MSETDAGGTFPLAHAALGAVLVLAPVGQDAEIIAGVLRDATIHAQPVDSIADVCHRFDSEDGVSVAGLIVTEEALAWPDDTTTLDGCLSRQARWSDMPICVLTVAGDTPSTSARWRLFETLGNVTLLARPLTAEALQSVARGILRSRARQRLTKRHLEELELAAQTLEQRIAERTEELVAAHETLRQAQKMEAIGQLTGGVAHDFNNLLQVIGTNTELLKLRVRHRHFNDIERYIQSIHDAMQRAASLTHRLLAFSRRQTLEPKPVLLNRLIEDLLGLVAVTLGPAITVKTHLDPGLHVTLCDPPQLENALINLCVNARDAMPDGGTLTISTLNRSLHGRTARLQDLAEGDYVIVEVHDTGCGMTPEIISRAFEPFFTTKPMGQGTGLGLSMVYGFARQSAGKIAIESTPEVGTTIRLYLPRLLEERDIVEQVAPDADSAAMCVSRTVLVVDDEAGVRAVSVEVLKEAGFNVLEAADGSAGLSLLESDLSIDVLVTDIGMPGMNGKEMADRGRRSRPDLEVIYITGYAEKSVFGDGNVEHGAHLLTKPFSMTDLIAQVNLAILNRQRRLPDGSRLDRT